MVIRSSLCLCGLISGCWIGPDTVQEKIDELPKEPETNLHISSLKPNYGSAAGGQEVAIEMLESCENPEVSFGQESAAVVERSSRQLVVRTPELVGGQWVDVSVTCDGGYAELDAAYQVFRDATDQVRSVGEFSWVEHIGGYWTEAAEDYGYASVYLFEPVILDYRDFFGSSMDRCESEYSLGGVQVDSMATYMDTVTLQSDTSDVELTYDSEGGWFSSMLDASEYARNVTYDLAPFGETLPWSETTVEDFVQTPSGELTITKPPMDGDTPPYVNSEFDLVWPGAGQGDYVLVLMDRYDSSDSYERVRCLLKDDGHFRVESGVFKDWRSGQYVFIRLGRAKSAKGVFPQDGAGSGMVGVYWVRGAGIQY